MKKKVGRPRKPKAEKKQVFALRLTQAELRSVRERAKEAGQKVTEWARNRLIAVIE